MRVVIDKYIPYLQGVLEPYCHVDYLSPEAITADAVKDADALIVRTRTQVNKELLAYSAVRFVATATIGFDHMDLPYLEEHAIGYCSCPGCNAQAVCDYIQEALPPDAHSIGIVGVGHVGSLVQQMAIRKGIQVFLSDPPKGLLDDVTQADVITFHTPLTKDGPYPTYHLCDTVFLSRCKPTALIINAARGGVVDESALLRSGNPFVLDCWEGEPDINQTVMAQARLASYHIAGYSVQGKRNASQTCLDALTGFFELPKLTITPDDGRRGDNTPGWLKRVSADLKAHPEDFELLRKNYKLR